MDPNKGISITIDTKDVEKMISVAPAKLERILEDVIYKASLLAERYSKQGAPVDTGRLRASISTSFRPLQATIGPHVRYAVYVHEGTRYISANPFMARAGESVQQLTAGLVQESLKSL